VYGLRKAAFHVARQKSTAQRFLRLSKMKNSQLQDQKPGEWIKSATVIAEVDYSGLEEKIMKAAYSCPVGVIKYKEA